MGLHSIAGISCILAFGIPSVAWSADLCATLTQKLGALETAAGTELVSSNAGKPYTALYRECDTGGTFNGRALPAHGQQQLKCGNNARYIRRLVDGTIAFNAKLDVDADGSPVSKAAHWPDSPRRRSSQAGNP